MQKGIAQREFNLNTGEQLARKEAILQEMDRRDALQIEFDNAKNYYKQQLELADNNIAKMRNAIKTGKELVELEVLYNYPSIGVKTITRRDNGDSYEEEMEADEERRYPPEMFE